MEYSVLCLLLCLTTSKDVSGQTIVASPNPAAVNSNVTLQVYPETSIPGGMWSHGSTFIMQWYPGGSFVNPTWESRITFNSTSKALSIRSVQVADSGIYYIQGPIQLYGTLSVQEPISNATLRADATDLVELNDTAVFTCSVTTGSSLSYLWLNGSSEVNASLVRLTNGGSTLSIPMVTRYDTGPFRCNVSNGISHDMARQSISLNISYGPSNPTITTNPKMAAYIVGSDITLSCSAQSNPNATYQWSFEGQPLNQGVTQLFLGNSKQTQTGNYTCSALNSVTRRSASMTTMIRIVEPISAVTVNSAGKQPIQNESFTLSCNVSGPADYIHWMKNNQMISADSFFSVVNKTLTINSVQHSDNGNYSCEAFNAVSNKTSNPYSLLVNFGPEMPVTTGRALALTGQNVTLTCSASSQPPSTYTWWFNGSQVATGSVYESGPLTSHNNGEFTCMAFNNITNKNSTASQKLTVIEPVTMATVKVLGAQPIANHTFNLTCETTGSVYSVHWMRDQLPLYPDSMRVFSMDNSTLTFSPVLLSDNGHYQCSATNPLSQMNSSNYTLMVNYGPDTPVVMGPWMAMMGQNVTLTCSASSQPPSHFTWWFNGSKVATGSVYESGPLTSHNNGEFGCMAFNNITNKNSTASHMLTVIAPITQVQIHTPLKSPVEGQSYTMNCNVTGPVDHVCWWKDGLLMSSNNRTDFAVDNQTLIINPIQHSDMGDYKCQAMNAVSNMTSNAYSLVVNYGPQTPTLFGPWLAASGANVTLTCSASSQPPSTYTWLFNGSQVATGSVYESGPLTSHNNGEFTCMAFNNITNKNSTASHMLTVIHPITYSTISDGGKPAILNESFSMTCSVDGESPSIHWMKDGSYLHTDHWTVFSMDNRTVTFNTVQLSNQAVYTCTASNAVSNYSSPGYMLVVNYGPEKPMIHGPTVGELGANVTLTCSASSQPPSHFTWWFNGSQVATGSVYESGTLTSHNNGEYTCMAFNNITNKNSTASQKLTLIAGITSITVKANTTPINLKQLTVTCEVNGSHSALYWMKNSVSLNGSTNSSLHILNNTLHFNPVTLSDDGTYQCVATNLAGNHTSPPYHLQVNYGPLDMSISGPDSAVIGSSVKVTLKCSADSWPTSQYDWLFNQKSLSKNNPILDVTVLKENAGQYTCNAINSVTNITMSKIHKLNITANSVVPLHSSAGLMLLVLVALFVPVVNDLWSH
ncbi:carcinoembryonic antigen-related cell adhesion molecule 5-like [Hypomesus transpacificus]|uniref:carcinoembryonic antigen-related cell adhesion molecule 5-like n=1 Tax=Hypomesus transpacificus TaxID=137520 RepID=UPI001F079CDE|nr:carcinoembryonic antigen-related cell adhesion molecule 5-like [Hypomesus transpacificus]